jgi:hypothetical protein
MQPTRNGKILRVP